MRSVVAIYVENNFGVLTRVAGLFMRKGFNIDTLSVGETEDPRYSRITVTFDGDDYGRGFLIKQLGDLYHASIVDFNPDVICVEVSGEPSIMEQFLDMIKPFGIVEMCRSGIICIDCAGNLFDAAE